VEPAIAALVSALTSVLVALVGAYVARKKGLPAINAEIEVRNAELITTLKDQVAALRSDLDDGNRDFAQCKEKLEEALKENRSLRRRVTLAEADLVDLYRQQGRQPPRRLNQTPNRQD
jgi:flagellar motility protein MotE (MotC chaperone)